MKSAKLQNCLPFFLLDTIPQFAFINVYKPPDTNKDNFIETINLHLDNPSRTKIINTVVCRVFNINLLNSSFTAL